MAYSCYGYGVIRCLRMVHNGLATAFCGTRRHVTFRYIQTDFGRVYPANDVRIVSRATELVLVHAVF